MSARIVPGSRVRVVSAIDREVYDVAEHIGRRGTVVRVERINQPGYHVRVGVARKVECFWREELEAVS